MCPLRFLPISFFFFFFNDTATTEIYTLSLHDALPILWRCRWWPTCPASAATCRTIRSEEHTSELQSLAYLVCRLLLEKKKSQELLPPCREGQERQSQRQDERK